MIQVWEGSKHFTWFKCTSETTTWVATILYTNGRNLTYLSIGLTKPTPWNLFVGRVPTFRQTNHSKQIFLLNVSGIMYCAELCCNFHVLCYHPSPDTCVRKWEPRFSPFSNCSQICLSNSIRGCMMGGWKIELKHGRFSDWEMGNKKFEVRICLRERRGGSAASVHRLSVGLAQRAPMANLKAED